MLFPTSLRLVDEVGYVAPSNLGVSIAKSLNATHLPYTFVGDYRYEYTIKFKFHFLKNLRRVLSGVTGDYRMSVEEFELYDDFVEYLSEDSTEVFIGERAVILEELDDWLVREIMELDQPIMPRYYSRENQWE